jgi:16S rRNA (uracil1498-N3)-methyltransferase
MRLHRFYIDTPISGSTFDVTNHDLVHQWRSVFRYNVGSQVILFNGTGTDYLCMISSLRSLGATLSVLRETKTEVTPRKNIWLCMALVKKDNFELITQKITELGVTHIVPILCEHSEKRKINITRLKKIIIEASEQSGRGDLPVIEPATTISDLFQKGILPQEKIVLHTEGGMTFDKYKSSTDQVSVAVFVGPEGGFSSKEMALFKSHNMSVVSLGSQILRAETAAIAISSLLLL